MEGGGRTGACPWWEGVWALLCPLLENEKSKGEYWPISAGGGGGGGINRRNIFVL